MALILEHNVESSVGGKTPITITVNITNNSSEKVEKDILLKYKIESGLEFIKESVSINEEVYTEYDPVNGIKFDKIELEEKINVTFKVLPISKETCDNLTSSIVLTSDSIKKKVSRENDSNVLEPNIRTSKFTNNYKNYELSINKNIDKIVVYISNDGTETTYNGVFWDKDSIYQEFIPESFEINGVLQRKANPNDGVIVGDIQAGEKIILSYEAIINKLSYSYKNKAYLTTEYKYNENGKSYIKSILIDELRNDKKTSCFKELNREEILLIPKEVPTAKEIINTLLKINITDSKVIKSKKRCSISGVKDTGAKLIVKGEICEKIEYIADIEPESVHAMDFKIPFSTFIMLPTDFDEKNLVSLSSKVEDISIKKIFTRKICQNIMFVVSVNFCDDLPYIKGQESFFILESK